MFSKNSKHIFCHEELSELRSNSIPQNGTEKCHCNQENFELSTKTKQMITIDTK